MNVQDEVEPVDPKSAMARARDCVDALRRGLRKKKRAPWPILLSRLEARIGIHLEAYARQEKSREGD